MDSTRLEQRIVEAVAGLPDDAAVTGWAALAWQGARWFNGLAWDGRTPLDVPVALSGDLRGARPRLAVDLTQDWLFADHLEMVDGLLVTVPQRSVTFEVRRARTLSAAVQIIDMAAASDLIDIAGLRSYAERLVARPGVKVLRDAIELADENVWSPMEPQMRVLWQVDGNHGRPRCNVPIFNLRGTHLFTPDLFDPVAGVAGEYDGAVHSGDGPRSRDLEREELVRRLGIELVTMMAGDLQRPGRFLRRLGSAYDRAADRSTEGRLWTVEPPDWWVDTSTVSARRALDADERAIWLRRNAS